MMNSISQRTSHPFVARTDTPGRFFRCAAEEISRGRERRTSLRSRLGVMGSAPEDSLESVLAAVIREGDAFEKWRNGREPLRNLQAVQRTRGVVTHLTEIDAHASRPFKIDLQQTNDSQIEIWECTDDREYKFPVFRLPLVAIESRSNKRVKETLRPDVHLLIAFKNTADAATLAIRLNASSATGDCATETIPYRLTPILNAYRTGIDSLCSNGAEALATAYESLKSRCTAALQWRTTALHPWQVEDARTDRLYRIGDLFRPALGVG